MRHLYALILGTGLSVPSLALAATPPEPGQRPVAQAVTSSSLTSVRAEPATAVKQDNQKQADRARYAAKEAQSGEAKDYRGGDTVVIGASAATAILAVILLLVLI